MTFREYLKLAGDRVDSELLRLLNEQAHVPARLRSAMEYSLFSGGKRLRPAMLLFAAGMFTESPASITAAAAVEMVHTYSLIHDDLPEMDDDDLRRGKPSCHRAFDGATAILAGDGLLTLAFLVLSGLAPLRASAETVVSAIVELARAAGPAGMVAGQMVDMSLGNDALPEQVERMHELKTGRMFQACVRLGGITGGCSAGDLSALTRFGLHFGRLFQAADDIEDAGKDASDVERSSLVEALGPQGALSYAETEATESLRCLEGFGAIAWWFRELISHVLSKVTCR